MLHNKRIIAEFVQGDSVIITIDDNMLSCEFGALDRGNLTDVLDWGIYANRGSISFIDNVGYFNNSNINSLEFKNAIVKFYLEKDQKFLIATFKIDSIEFNDETREVNVELVSNLLNLTKEKTTESVYPFYSRKTSALLELINEKIPSYKISVGEDAENINHTFIDCPYIGIDTVWNVMTKICQATMCRIVEDEYGHPIITGSFPTKSAIVVNPNNIINIGNADFFRIENASIDVTDRTIYNNTYIDETSKTFSIERDESSVVIGANGLTDVSISSGTEGYNYYRSYINGKVTVKTTKKIYKVSSDDSLVNQNVKFYSLSGSKTITENKDHTSSMSLCSNVTLVNETEISAEIENFRVDNLFTKPESYAHDLRVTGGTIRFPVSTFVDNGTKTLSITSETDAEQIQSNDLIQEHSYRYLDSYTESIPLGNYILNEVKKRYSNGIECYEIECLFNTYFYEDGSVAFSGNDLSSHFKKYDVIIPYVMKKGQNVPLRKNEDGTPKKFRIIGISYSYDGLLRQKLSVQEERYDVD